MKLFSGPFSLVTGVVAMACLAGCAAPSATPSTASAAGAAGTAVPAAGVSRPGFDSKPLLTRPISGDDLKEIVVIAVAIAPGASSPPHTHPGDCVGTVVEGQVELRVAGQAPQQVLAGTAFSNPRGAVHQFVNTSDKPARMVTTLVVEKGKPRTMMQTELK